MIALSIDVSRIPKDRIKAIKRRDGSTGQFLDLILFDNKDGTDQYGNDGMVKLSTTQEERTAGLQLPIIGNFKRLGQKTQAEPQQRPPRKPPVTPAGDDGDDIPF